LLARITGRRAVIPLVGIRDCGRQKHALLSGCQSFVATTTCTKEQEHAQTCHRVLQHPHRDQQQPASLRQNDRDQQQGPTRPDQGDDPAAARRSDLAPSLAPARDHAWQGPDWALALVRALDRNRSTSRLRAHTGVVGSGNSSGPGARSRCTASCLPSRREICRAHTVCDSVSAFHTRKQKHKQNTPDRLRGPQVPIPCRCRCRWRWYCQAHCRARFRGSLAGVPAMLPSLQAGWHLHHDPRHDWGAGRARNSWRARSEFAGGTTPCQSSWGPISRVDTESVIERVASGAVH
jgi:hypothetical protein